jgi:Tat protein translocase TatC
MTIPGGEMPFLDHLEELRMRLLRALGAIVVGFAAGLWLVERLQLVALLKAPIAPYLPDGKLTFLSPTEPLMIVFKLGFVVGLLLASPVLIYQAWAFLSPALYDRERKVIFPALVVGLGLFLVGASLGYVFVVPQALRVFFSFQAESLQPMITYDAWFGFVLQIVLALGISFELPLVIIIMAALGVVTPAGLHRFRRYAVVLSFVAGAVLSPGADVFSMLMMTAPLLLLYEIGVAGAVFIARRRLRQERPSVLPLLLFALLLGGLATPANAQVPTPGRAAGQDTTRAPPGRGPGQLLDSAQAERLGLPTAPSQTFAPEDSAYRSLLGRPGYTVTRYRADSAAILAAEKQLMLMGHAMTEREGTTMEAEDITYDQPACRLLATGEPKIFNEGQVLVGEELQYNTCDRRGVFAEALTNFKQGSTTWFLRGDVVKDSLNNRIFAGHGDITSCDLPVPHYHFNAREIKWVSNTVLVARPVVLYIQDVPVLWLPFIFQDLRPGRHSGLLIPQFGFSDIIRPSPSYSRQIENVGYYWAVNDYMDLTGRINWFSGRYVSLGFQTDYRWLNRFLSGTFALNNQWESGGGSSFQVRWNHVQKFNLTTNISLDLGYASNTQVINNNAVDPLVNTQQITSALRFTKQYRWGAVNIGGSRRQDISNGAVTQTLPQFDITPKPIGLGANSTWSPNFSFSQNQVYNQPRGYLLFRTPAGTIDSVQLTTDSRTTSAQLTTPFRFGSFNWSNTVRYSDNNLSGRDSTFAVLPDTSTTNPGDSLVVVRYFAGTFNSTFDWDTGINLPFLLRGTWKIQPTIGVQNVTGGAFAIRNRNTGGDWVVQGKRAQFSLSMTPTFFAFFNVGFIPGLSRMRHSINPLITWSFAPAATVPEAYAEAIALPGQQLELRSQPQNLLSLALNQNFEVKARPAPEDTLGTQARKYRLLSIQTSPIQYDFQQAGQPNGSGWITNQVTNSVLSDLVPGFNLGFAFDLWQGNAGVDTSHFAPYLTNLNMNFNLSTATFRSLFGGSQHGVGGQPPGGSQSVLNDPNRNNYLQNQGSRPIRPATSYDVTGAGTQRGFTSSVAFTVQRFRPSDSPAPLVKPQDQVAVNYTLQFSPTQFWAASWQAQYNFSLKRFEAQTVTLSRELHEWRASFRFVRNANGNFAFFFSIFLTDLPDLRYDYQQTTFEQ